MFSFPLCSLAFSLCRILLYPEFQVGWPLLIVHSLWVIHAFVCPLYRAFFRMCFYALTSFTPPSVYILSVFPCVSPPLLITSSPRVSRYFSFTMALSSFLSSFTLAMCFLSWVLSCVLSTSVGLPAVFPVRSRCSLMFLVSSEIRSSCIPPFPADYLSFSSPMRSVLFSVSSVLCSRCVSLYETFVFHHLPANLSYQFAVRMFVHAFPVCFFKWNPYVSPWVPNGFPPIPRRAVVMCSFAFPVCFAPWNPRTLHRYGASAWVRGGIPSIFPVHLQCFRKTQEESVIFLVFPSCNIRLINVSCVFIIWRCVFLQRSLFALVIVNQKSKKLTFWGVRFISYTLYFARKRFFTCFEFVV